MALLIVYQRNVIIRTLKLSLWPRLKSLNILFLHNGGMRKWIKKNILVVRILWIFLLNIDQIFKNIFVFVDLYAYICTHVLAWKLENILLLTLSTYLFEVGFLPHPRTHSFSTRLEATKLQQFSFLCPIHSLSYRHSQNTLLVSYMGASVQTPVFMVVLQRFIITEFSVQLQIRSSLPYLTSSWREV